MAENWEMMWNAQNPLFHTAHDFPVILTTASTIKNVVITRDAFLQKEDIWGSVTCSLE